MFEWNRQIMIIEMKFLAQHGTYENGLNKKSFRLWAVAAYAWAKLETHTNTKWKYVAPQNSGGFTFFRPGTNIFLEAHRRRRYMLNKNLK